MRIRQEYAVLIKIGSGAIKPLGIFIGVEVSRNRSEKTITLTQTKYIEKLAKLFDGKFTPLDTPIRNATKFDKMESPKEGEDTVSQHDYLQGCGSVLWPANMTRPEAMYAASNLCTFMGEGRAGPVQFAAVMDLVGYYVHTMHLGVSFGGKLKVPFGLKEYPPNFIESGGLCTYTDSSFGKAVKPYGGYCVMYCNGPVSYSARISKIVPDATSHAEMDAGSSGAKETVATRLVLEDVGRRVAGTTPIIIDSQAMRDIIVKPGATKKTRHYEKVTMIVKRLFELLVVAPYLISTEFMVADLFTKAVGSATFYRLRAKLMNMPVVTARDESGQIVTLYGKAARWWNKLVNKA